MLNKLLRREEQQAQISGRAIVRAISDTHGGHTGALMNPDTTLTLFDPEGSAYEYKPQMTEIQKHLWNVLMDALSRIDVLAAGSPLFDVHGGDQVEGNKHPSELVTTDLYAQIQIAVNNRRPMLTNPAVVADRDLYGTGAHEFGQSSATRTILMALKKEYPRLDIAAVMHGLFDINGVTFDCAHHRAGPGQRKWLHGNVARYYLRDRMMLDLGEGNKPADVYLGGHYHTPVVEYLRVDGCWSVLVVMPSMKMGGEYAAQATRSVPYVKNGLMAFEIEGGKLRDIHEFIQTFDMRTKEVFVV